MKKKNIITSILLSVLMAVTLSLGFTSCGSDEEEPKTIVSTAINEAGELIINYSDGSFENLGVVVGKDGADGIDGADGKDGIDGSDGKDSTDITSLANKIVRSAVRVSCTFTVDGEESSSGGAGVIYRLDKENGDAYIITNYHVIYNSQSKEKTCKDIDVYIYGSEYVDHEIPAKFIGGSYKYDIAVLKITGSERIKEAPILAATFADSNDIWIGDSVIAAGNHLGDGIAVTTGVISVESETIHLKIDTNEDEVQMRVIRIDASVNHGSSGGGLFNADGNLIGIVNAKVDGLGVEGMGYAIPSNIAVTVADSVIENCNGSTKISFQRPLIGVTIKTTEKYAVYDSETGKVRIEEKGEISEFTETSIAKDKLEVGDVIFEASINGGESVKLVRDHYLTEMILGMKAGDTLTLKVDRDGEEIVVDITITKGCFVDY